MAKMKGVVIVNTERCKGCNLCVVSMPAACVVTHPESKSKRI